MIHLYLGSRGPGSRWFPDVAPGSLCLRGPGQDECNLWTGFSDPDLHRTASRGSRGPRATGPHRLDSAPRSSSTCRVHSRCKKERRGEMPSEDPAEEEYRILCSPCAAVMDQVVSRLKLCSLRDVVEEQR